MVALDNGLAVGQLVPNEVVDRLECPPVSVIRDLCVLVEDPLLRAQAQSIVAQVTGDEVLHVGHGLKELDFLIVVVNLVGHGSFANRPEALKVLLGLEDEEAELFNLLVD